MKAIGVSLVALAGLLAGYLWFSGSSKLEVERLEPSNHEPVEPPKKSSADLVATTPSEIEEAPQLELEALTERTEATTAEPEDTETPAALEEWIGSPHLARSGTQSELLGRIISLNGDAIENITFEATGSIRINGHTLVYHELYDDGPFTSEYDDGTIRERGQYLHGRKVGLWTTWHANGKRESEGRYVHGARHGLWTNWHQNGERSSTGDYLYDRYEGAWLTYRQDGSKEELSNYVNGERDGACERWHANGARKESSNYVFGEADGAWRGWHENGQLEARGQYERGSKVGHWEYRDEEGNLDEDSSGKYENGAKVEE